MAERPPRQGSQSHLTTWEGSAGDYLAISDTPEGDRAALSGSPALLAELYYADRPVPADILNRTLDRILATAGYLLPSPHPLRTMLVGTLRTAIATIRQREEDWKAGKWDSDTIPTVLPAPAPAKVMPAMSTGPAAAAPAHRTIRLSGLFDAYVERMKPKSTTEQKLAIRQLCSFLGQPDPLVHEITFEQAEQFYDTLKWLPRSMTAAIAARPLSEIAEEMRSGEMDLQRAAGATATKKLQLLSAMFSFAAARGWIPSGNPFARVTGPKDAKPVVKRRPMKPEHLAAIFSAPLFSGCASYIGWRQPGTVLIANHRFWLPLLGLVTGSRLEEIGQLLISDVRKEEDICL